MLWTNTLAASLSGSTPACARMASGARSSLAPADFGIFAPRGWTMSDQYAICVAALRSRPKRARSHSSFRSSCGRCRPLPDRAIITAADCGECCDARHQPCARGGNGDRRRRAGAGRAAAARARRRRAARDLRRGLRCDRLRHRGGRLEARVRVRRRRAGHGVHRGRVRHRPGRVARGPRSADRSRSDDDAGLPGGSVRDRRCSANSGDLSRLGQPLYSGLRQAASPAISTSMATSAGSRHWRTRATRSSASMATIATAPG